MIRVSTQDPAFNKAWAKAYRALPVLNLEQPRQYGERWRDEYRCRVDGLDSTGIGTHTYYVFDCDADYTWFMLRWG